MKTNKEYFDYCGNNPEDLLDSFYAKELLVIPKKRYEFNNLTQNNEKLLKLITAFDFLNETETHKNNTLIKKIVDDIITILDKTSHINYSAFVQFFMVYNFTYSSYKELKSEDKRIFIYEILKKYCKERHGIYLSHGYSNVLLQVMCDNYSHKRNSKTGIEKILNILKPYISCRITKTKDWESNIDYYFLPDKGDKEIFEYMLKRLELNMESRKIEQNKLPDIVFKHNEDYYICELKSMKESGGGQNKQIVEIANFIKFSEKNKNVHYLTFLDCNYSNKIFQSMSPKIKCQRQDIKKALECNPNNYFLNTKGFIEFVKELWSKKT